MRSVFVFPAADVETVRARIAALDPPGLFVDFHTTADDAAPLYRDWEPEAVAALTAALGHRPEWAVGCRISGRIEGGAELCTFVLALIKDGGVVLDDYSDHPWTATEILDETRVDGLAFFDGRTSFERLYPQVRFLHGVQAQWLAVDAHGRVGCFSGAAVPRLLAVDELEFATTARREGVFAFEYAHGAYELRVQPRTPTHAPADGVHVWLPTADFAAKCVWVEQVNEARRLSPPAARRSAP